MTRQSGKGEIEAKKQVLNSFFLPKSFKKSIIKTNQNAKAKNQNYRLKIAKSGSFIFKFFTLCFWYLIFGFLF